MHPAPETEPPPPRRSRGRRGSPRRPPRPANRDKGFVRNQHGCLLSRDTQNQTRGIRHENLNLSLARGAARDFNEYSRTEYNRRVPSETLIAPREAPVSLSHPGTLHRPNCYVVGHGAKVDTVFERRDLHEQLHVGSKRL